MEPALAGTNAGSLRAGVAVGRAGGAGSVPEFGFEGFRETGWTGKEKETMRTKKKKKKIDSGGQKDADTYLQETSAARQLR